ncbi:CBS domain-containing protein [Halobacteroides halobius DSM 5150]|uniref:Hut operon positive regulatory protein n=1 Tax=Halobacteroides halobius (strain ATCC 35273 / DSM 5150 / MD-1) TaxID=748449 RepID=L0K6L6_HALHC|nr:HutP family protein [Halobacteroides halobius]AGB40175.1 CBS domain-containing protein [Halobacteroides halobius DSM 5150]
MLVEKIMTKQVVTVNPSTTIEEAERLLDANDIGRLVVIDDEEVVGIITDGDLVQHHDLNNTISNVMETDLITIRNNKSIQEAAQLLSDHRIGGVPVLDNVKKLVGIVTAEDIVAGYVREEQVEKLSPESSAIYLSMTRSREYEDYWLDKIKGYGYQVAITQTGANAENLPIKLRESTTVAAIARGVIKENLREKMAVSNAVKDAYTQLELVNPGLGGGFKVAIVRGRGRLAVSVFGKFGHALVDGPEQLAVGMSVV